MKKLYVVALLVAGMFSLNSLHSQDILVVDSRIRDLERCH